jgi:hypothetical protein
MILYSALTLVSYAFFAMLIHLFFRPWLLAVGVVLLVGLPWFWTWLYQESNRYEATQALQRKATPAPARVTTAVTADAGSPASMAMAS